MKPDLLHTTRHLVQVLAFCLVISALQYLFHPERPYEVPLVYSLSIGLCTWFITDMGRFVVGMDPMTSWPRGWRGPALVGFGMVTGYTGGTLLSDYWFGWSTWHSAASGDLRGSVIITVVAGVVISSYFYLQGKSMTLQRRMKVAESQATEAQLRLLLTQLEPHMLFNTLANLRVLVGIDPARAQHMLDHLIAYLRATLSASRATEHGLQAEFDRLRDYLALMEVRMGPRLSYSLELPVALRQASVPPLLLQPLVENSIRHGLEPKVEGGHITVEAQSLPGADGAPALLQITVSDTGVGLRGDAPAPPAAPHPTPDLGRGFGLTQVRERLRTLYGPQASLSLQHGPGGGTVVLLRYALQTLPESPTANRLADAPEHA